MADAKTASNILYILLYTTPAELLRTYQAAALVSAKYYVVVLLKELQPWYTVVVLTLSGIMLH